MREWVPPYASLRDVESGEYNPDSEPTEPLVAVVDLRSMRGRASSVLSVCMVNGVHTPDFSLAVDGFPLPFTDSLASLGG